MPPFLYIVRTKKGAFLFILYRTAEHVLAQWLAAPQRKPLVIRGARQVGKSTLVRQFAQSQRRHLNEINLDMTLLSLPLYLVGQLGRLLDRLRQGTAPQRR